MSGDIDDAARRRLMPCTRKGACSVTTALSDADIANACTFAAATNEEYAACVLLSYCKMRLDPRVDIILPSTLREPPTNMGLTSMAKSIVAAPDKSIPNEDAEKRLNMPTAEAV
jgi:hypothetical protein